MTNIKIDPRSEEAEVAYYTTFLPQIFADLESEKKGSSEILEGHVSDSDQITAFIKTLISTGYTLEKSIEDSRYHLREPTPPSNQRFSAAFYQVLMAIVGQPFLHP